MVFVSKQPGETPLEALARYRATRPDLSANTPMTYAGRLDPMASGTLLVLIGEECKKKDSYLNLDKEYEIEVLFGISTDTHDALGLGVISEKTIKRGDVAEFLAAPSGSLSDEVVSISEAFLKTYVGKLTQEYPAYSSKTVDGVQLHELARAGNLPEEMPTKEVEIYSIEKIGERRISAADLQKEISNKVRLVRGNFRQEEILKQWGVILGGSQKIFDVIKLKVKCSSGTYMRSLADRMGKDVGTGGFALSIKRNKIFLK